MMGSTGAWNEQKGWVRNGEVRAGSSGATYRGGRSGEEGKGKDEDRGADGRGERNPRRAQAAGVRGRGPNKADNRRSGAAELVIGADEGDHPASRWR
jgi:hypothetical protein